MSDPHPSLARAQSVHQEILAARDDLRRAEHRLAHLLRDLEAEKLHRLLGFSSFTAYAGEALGLDARKARDLLTIGRVLPDLPLLDEALATGRVQWTKARELVRVIEPETEAAWVQRATEVTSRVLERQVARSLQGEAPPDDGEDREPARTKITITAEASDADVIRQALALLRSRANLSGEELDDGAALAAMARNLIGTWNDDPPPSGEPYRIVVEHCPSCARTTGVEAELSDTVASEACCDAEVVELREGPDRGSVSRTIPAATRRAVLATYRWTCAVPHCRCRLWLDVHHLTPWSEGGRHDEANLAPFCPLHHRLIHAGLLRAERDSEGELVVEHVDGRRYVGRRLVSEEMVVRRNRSGVVTVRRPRRCAEDPRGSGVEGSTEDTAPASAGPG